MGQYLVERGLLRPEALREALAEQAGQPTKYLGEILLDRGLVTEEILLEALASQGHQVVDLAGQAVSPEFLKLLPEAVARGYQVLPLDLDGNTLVVASWRPGSRLANLLTFTLKRPVRLVLASRRAIAEAIDAYYRLSSDLGEHLRSAPGAEASGDGSALARTVDLIVAQGVRARASDIHIEPQDGTVVVRYRIDGVLHDGTPLPAHLAPAIVSRIKVLAGLSIVEKLLPQDGQMLLTVEGREVDVRVSVLPSVKGEKAVLRLLDRRSTHHLGALGLVGAELDLVRELVRAPFGMVLVAGPTGAGKTTTLYGCLHELDCISRNIMTLEDPVEYVLPRITQVAVNPRVGLGFAAGLRAMLRQDPDVVVVGEIRDRETAEIAVQAALTGHLVLSSIHATDCVQAVYRLVDIGVQPYLLAAGLSGVISQRLVRRVCPRCAAAAAPSPEEEVFLARAGAEDGATYRRGTGCGFCAGTGFFGRTGLFQTLRAGDELRRLVARAAPAADLYVEARRTGMATLGEVGLRLAAAGITTPGEILRVVGTA